MSDGVVTMPFVVQLRVCDANLKADTAGRNPVWFQRRRIPRCIDFHRNSLRRRCGNAMPNLTARLQCMFKGKRQCAVVQLGWMWAGSWGKNEHS